MNYEIKDPFNALVGLVVDSVSPTGIAAHARIPQIALNSYSVAHGGYVYALGHVAAVQSAKFGLGRTAVVVNASSQYLCSLRISPARVKTELMRSGRELMVYRVNIFDGNGALCFTQSVELKEVDYPATKDLTFSPTIVPADENTPIDPVTGKAYPRPAPFFATLCHIYALGRGEQGITYGADLYPDNCNLYGAAHGGMIYTACDCAVGGSLLHVHKTKNVTVSSTIRYLRSAMVGPVKAVGKPMRDGKRMHFYNVDVTDGNGDLVAVAEFVMQSVNYNITNDPDTQYVMKTMRE